MQINQLFKWALLVILSLWVFSCAEPEAIESCVDLAEEKGFLWGLVHGFIAPLAFIFSLFTEDVTIYAVNNNGAWYNFGFLLGIGGFSGGIFKSSKKK